MEALQKDGYDFTVGIPMDTPIMNAERVVSAGKGIGEKKNMKLIEDLARSAGAAIGSSRPVAETLKYVPINRYVGMSGQKFTGNLYIACGISGAGQHLKGIKDATTIVCHQYEMPMLRSLKMPTTGLSVMLWKYCRC